MTPRAKKVLVFAPLWIVLCAVLFATVRFVRTRNAPRIPPPFPVCTPDAVFGRVLKPGFAGRHVTDEFAVGVRVNSLGMRGPEISKEKRKGTFRVAFVGDSFTFGWGVEVEQSFVGQLREQWQDRIPRVEVLDFGVPGWSADQVLVLLRRQLFDFEPDLVVLQMCVNDLPGLCDHVCEIDDDKLPLAVQMKPKLTQDELREALLELKRERGVELADMQKEMTEQQIDDYVRTMLEKAKRKRAVLSGEAPVGEIARLSSEELARALDSGPVFQARYLVHLLEAMESECSKRKVPLRFMLIDDGSSDDGEKAALRSVRAWLETKGDAYLDADRFLPFARSSDFFESDPHWTVEGHRKAALEIRDWLEPALPR